MRTCQTPGQKSRFLARPESSRQNKVSQRGAQGVGHGYQTRGVTVTSEGEGSRGTNELRGKKVEVRGGCLNFRRRGHTSELQEPAGTWVCAFLRGSRLPGWAAQACAQEAEGRSDGAGRVEAPFAPSAVDGAGRFETAHVHPGPRWPSMLREQSCVNRVSWRAAS